MKPSIKNCARYVFTDISFRYEKVLMLTSKYFDYLFQDHEVFKIGNLSAYNSTNTWTYPSMFKLCDRCTSYLWVIRSLCQIMETARCDFPKGSAFDLIVLGAKLVSIARADTGIFLCHDYLPENRSDIIAKVVFNYRNRVIFILMKILKNKSLLICVSAVMRHLSMPKLILPAIQVNMCAGHFPEPAAKWHSLIESSL